MFPELVDLLTQSVTVEPWSSTDAWGNDSYSAGTAFAARVVRKNRVVRDNEGNEVVSGAQVYVNGGESITSKDRVTLPNGEQPKIVSVEKYPDERGDVHAVVFLG